MIIFELNFKWTRKRLKLDFKRWRWKKATKVGGDLSTGIHLNISNR